MRAVLIAIAVAGCQRPAARQPLYAAGSEKDEGAGLLAHASSTLITSEDAEPSVLPASRTDATYGGTSYGGATYAGYVAPSWPYPSANRAPHYTTLANLTGVIEGTLTWRGGTAPKLATSCGPINAPSVAGALVYIEHVATGRVLSHESGDRRPATVGGVIAKKGCALLPTAQIVTPLPAPLSIHGDGTPTKLRVTAPGGAATTHDLEAGGRVAMQARPGITRVEAEDATLGAAWIVALDTPAYAITDDAGRFRLEELAPGTYDVTVWLPPAPMVRDGRVTYGEPMITHRSVTVVAAHPARLDVALP